MKKLLFFLLLIPVLAIAQERFEAQAKKTAAKMTEVLSLSTEEAERIYKAEFNKVKDVAALRASGEEPSVFRPKVAARNKAYGKEVEEIIGAEKFQKWAAYVAAEKAKNQ